MDLLDTMTTMELFVDEASSRTLLPRVDCQVVEAKLVAMMFTCNVGIEWTARGYFIDNDDNDDGDDDDNDDDDDDDAKTVASMLTCTKRIKVELASR